MAHSPRSPKILIFLTIFIDLLGFGIVIPILAPTSAEFINKSVITRVVRATSQELGLAEGVIAFDNLHKRIQITAGDRAGLEAAEGALERRLTASKIKPEDLKPQAIETPAGGGARRTILLSDTIEAGGVGMAVALLMTSFSLLQMLFSPLWGRLSDRYGRRPILLLSLFGSTVSYVLFAVSRSYELLLFSRVLAGISAANITAALAYIADITEDHDRTAGIGMVGMAFGLGIAFGPVIGGGATDLWERIWPNLPPSAIHVGAGVVAALICGVNLVWAAVKLPESLPPERRGKVRFERFAGVREALATLRNPIVGPLILLLFLVTFAFANLEVSFSLYAKGDLGMDLKEIYGLFVFIGLVMALTQGFLVRRVVKTVPEQTLMVWGAVILVVGLALLPVWRRTGPMLMALGILSVGQGLCQPSVLSLISRRTKATAQGNVFGTSQSASALARIVGPAFGGMIYDLGHRLPFWGAAAIMAGSVWWAWVARGRLMRQAASGGDAGAVGPADA